MYIYQDDWTPLGKRESEKDGIEAIISNMFKEQNDINIDGEKREDSEVILFLNMKPDRMKWQEWIDFMIKKRVTSEVQLQQIFSKLKLK